MPHRKQQSSLTPYRSSIPAVHVRHCRVIRGRLCSFHLTPLRIRTFHRVTISLDHERHVTLVVTATVTYALIYVAGSTVRAKLPRVYPADQRDVVAYRRVVAHRLSFSGLCCWFGRTRSDALVVSIPIYRQF